MRGAGRKSARHQKSAFEEDLNRALRLADSDRQPVRRMLAAPNLIAATVERLDAREGREKITREDFERIF